MFSIIILIISTTFFLVKANDYSLFGYVILLDPGHGGKDNGAYYNDLLEDEINLKICLKLSNLLIEKGAIVYLTRDGDYDLSEENVNNRKKSDMKNRLKLINTYKPDLFISIHMNSFPLSSVNGAQVFYHNNYEIANIMQNRLNVFNDKNKKSKKSDFYLIKNSFYQSLLIECGFLTGDKDYNNLHDDNYLNLVSNSIFLGIVDCLLFVN